MAAEVEERWLRRWAVVAVLALAVLACERTARPGGAGAGEDARIVSLGGAVTEAVFALGAGDRVVAVDATSVHPAEADARPDVGYLRAISAEGVLAHSPDVVVALAEAGPPAALEQLRAAGVRVVVVPAGHDPAAAAARIVAVGDAIGAPDEGRALAARVTADTEAAVAAARSAASRRASRCCTAAAPARSWCRGPGPRRTRCSGSPARSTP